MTLDEMRLRIAANRQRMLDMMTFCKFIDPFNPREPVESAPVIDPVDETILDYPGAELWEVVEGLAITLGEETDKTRAEQALRRVHLNLTMFLEELETFVEGL